MSQPTHPLLSLVESNRNGLKSMLTSYIDATVDSHYNAMKLNIVEMIQSGLIGPQQSHDVTAFGTTSPPPTQANTDQSSAQCSQEYSNDTLTRAQEHHNNLQNEVSLSNTINTESMVKQEFDDGEDGEEIDEDNVAKCEKRICTSGDNADTRYSIFNQQVSSQPSTQPTTINEEIETTTNEPMSTHQVQSCSCAPVSNEQSKHNLTNQHCNDNDECVGGEIEVKEEDDEEDQVDEESFRPVKRPKMDTTKPNNAQAEVVKQSPRQATDEAQSNEDRPHEEGEQSEAIDTQATFGENSDDVQNNGISECYGYKVSNEFLQNELTQRSRDPQIHFDDDLEIDQETLDEVKREIEEEKEMKRRENEHEGGDERRDEGDRVGSELSEATNTQTDFGENFQQNDNETEIDDEEYEMKVDGEELSDGDDETEVDEQLDQVPDDRIELHRNATKAIDIQTTFGKHNSDESIVIQQEERDANNAIGEELIATECTTNPIQANLAQPNRQWQCSHCHKSFDFMSYLRTHLRVHTGERPFQCDQCEKRFRFRSNLTQHQLIHQNIKRFRCHECDKQFTLKQQLEVHLLIHSGERPFKCRHCEMSFAELCTRNRHEQAIHLHVKPYRCKQCGHTATHRANIITHIRMAHFGLPKSIKQQRALNIIDDRDPRELLEKV